MWGTGGRESVPLADDCVVLHAVGYQSVHSLTRGGFGWGRIMVWVVSRLTSTCSTSYQSS